MDTYSTDSFLLAMRRFMCLRGTPTRIQSDRGEQLVTASEQENKSFGAQPFALNLCQYVVDITCRTTLSIRSQKGKYV
jgi:hypothetical protein